MRRQHEQITDPQGGIERCIYPTFNFVSDRKLSLFGLGVIVVSPVAKDTTIMTDTQLLLSPIQAAQAGKWRQLRGVTQYQRTAQRSNGLDVS